MKGILTGILKANLISVWIWMSYTSFNYSGFETEGTVSAGDSVRVHISVTNTGSYDGDEVVQLY